FHSYPARTRFGGIQPGSHLNYVGPQASSIGLGEGLGVEPGSLDQAIARLDNGDWQAVLSHGVGHNAGGPRYRDVQLGKRGAGERRKGRTGGVGMAAESQKDLAPE